MYIYIYVYINMYNGAVVSRLHDSAYYPPGSRC